MRYAIRMESSAGPHLYAFRDTVPDLLKKLLEVARREGTPEDVERILGDLEDVGPLADACGEENLNP